MTYPGSAHETHAPAPCGEAREFRRAWPVTIPSFGRISRDIAFGIDTKMGYQVRRIPMTFNLGVQGSNPSGPTQATAAPWLLAMDVWI